MIQLILKIIGQRGMDKKMLKDEKYPFFLYIFVQRRQNTAFIVYAV